MLRTLTTPQSQYCPGVCGSSLTGRSRGCQVASETLNECSTAACHKREHREARDGRRERGALRRPLRLCATRRRSCPSTESCCAAPAPFDSAGRADEPERPSRVLGERHDPLAIVPTVASRRVEPAQRLANRVRVIGRVRAGRDPSRARPAPRHGRPPRLDQAAVEHDGHHRRLFPRAAPTGFDRGSSACPRARQVPLVVGDVSRSGPASRRLRSRRARGRRLDSETQGCRYRGRSANTSRSCRRAR